MMNDNERLRKKIFRIGNKTGLFIDYFHAFWKLILSVVGGLSFIGLIRITIKDIFQKGRIDRIDLFFGFLLLSFLGFSYLLFRWGWKEFKACRIKGKTLSTIPLPPPSKTKTGFPPATNPIIKLIGVLLIGMLWGSILVGQGMRAATAYFLVMLFVLILSFVQEMREIKKGGWRFLFTWGYWLRSEYPRQIK